MVNCMNHTIPAETHVSNSVEVISSNEITITGYGNKIISDGSIIVGNVAGNDFTAGNNTVTGQASVSLQGPGEPDIIFANEDKLVLPEGMNNTVSIDTSVIMDNDPLLRQDPDQFDFSLSDKKVVDEL